MRAAATWSQCFSSLSFRVPGRYCLLQVLIGLLVTCRALKSFSFKAACTGIILTLSKAKLPVITKIYVIDISPYILSCYCTTNLDLIHLSAVYLYFFCNTFWLGLLRFKIHLCPRLHIHNRDQMCVDEESLLFSSFEVCITAINLDFLQKAHNRELWPILPLKPNASTHLFTCASCTIIQTLHYIHTCTVFKK